MRRTIKEADKDKDNYINLEEFKQVRCGLNCKELRVAHLMVVF